MNQVNPRRMLTLLLFLLLETTASGQVRRSENFDHDWRFFLGEVSGGERPEFDASGWRPLSLPHDWSIEGAFSRDHPATYSGGALPGGIGWYRKTFVVPATSRGKRVYIEFDGVYRDSEVWINGHRLGKRPNGYISFRYDLSDHLRYGPGQPNVIAVRVDNSRQPNSRWYSGSGIYRHVRLLTTSDLAVDQWGTFITTPKVNNAAATVVVQTQVRSFRQGPETIAVKTSFYDPAGNLVKTVTNQLAMPADTTASLRQAVELQRPLRWSVGRPVLYKAVTQILVAGKTVDRYETSFGIRSFRFDPDSGFYLNGRPLRLYGVNQHHDLGALGAAVNDQALIRQLRLLQKMGVNAIRTSHNPPAPELLDWCDQLGFVVIDEAFDMWKRPKNPYDYHLNWDEWHARDLSDQVLRDRNHPSVIAWSVGNEVPEQWDLTGPDHPNAIPDTSGATILRELIGIVRALDTTRPITAATDQIHPGNNVLLNTRALDLLGYNYRHQQWKDVQKRWGHKPFIGSETASAFETRGIYEMPADTIRRFPENFGTPRQDLTRYRRADLLASSYDNYSAGWGSTHEEALREFDRLPFMAGTFIWTGFDYLGEPTPYEWPARSSYFGVIDLAGFPKDGYYLYQSLWADRPMLHLQPHWNWSVGDNIDVRAHYSHADEVELFLNGRSLGIRRKTGDALHVQWRVPFEAGELRAVSRKNGKTIRNAKVVTAGPPARIILELDGSPAQPIKAHELAFVAVRIVDARGNLVPGADNLLHFDVQGNGFLRATDNGSPIDHTSFQSPDRKAFSGRCLAIVQATRSNGAITLRATSPGLKSAAITLGGGRKN